MEDLGEKVCVVEQFMLEYMMQEELKEMNVDFVFRVFNNEERIEELKREGFVLLFQIDWKEELKSQDSVFFLWVEKIEGRKEQVNFVEELRIGGNKGKGFDSVGCGGKGVGGRSSKIKIN